MNEYPPSPVPSDAYLLRPGELPFTAFGQHGEGKMDNRVFEQDVYWVDSKGAPHLLAEMDDVYRINVIMHLRDNADYFWLETIKRWAFSAMDIALFGDRTTAQIVLDTAEQMALMEPIDWLESTPLLTRLRALVDASENEATA